jgi:hypothetical protein
VRPTAARQPGLWVAGAAVLGGSLGPALEPQRWWPALMVVTVGMVILAHRGPTARPTRVGVWALWCALGWATWSALSVSWAADPAWAWEAAGRAWLVTGVLAVLLLWPGTATPRERAVNAAVLVAGGATLQAVIAWGGTLSGTPLADGRLRGAMPYANALALLMVAGALAAIGLAAGAATARARGAWTALAVVLLATGLAAQSRSSVPVLVVGLLVAVAGGGLRRAGTVAVLACAGAIGVTAGAVLSVRTAVLTGAGVPQRAGLVLTLVLLAAVAAGAVAALAGTAPGPRAPRLPRPLRATLLGAAGLVALVPVAAAMSTRADVDYQRVESASSRFVAGVGSNRPDMWRVAWRVLREHPVGGVGAGSFERPYLRLRRAEVAPRFAHSVPAEAAATLGVPGLLLVLGAVAALLAGALARIRHAPEAAWLAAAGCAIVAHGLVDWTTELPIVAAVAVVALGAVHEPGPPPATRPWRVRGRLVAAGLVAATLIMLPVAVSATLAQRRQSDTTVDVDARLDRLELAARLSPLDPRPLESRALLALVHGRTDTARRSAAEALARDPDGWLALWLGGVLDVDGRGQRLLERAAAQNPQERVIRFTSAARHDRPVDLDRALALLGPEG